MAINYGKGKNDLDYDLVLTEGEAGRCFQKGKGRAFFFEHCADQCNAM